MTNLTNLRTRSILAIAQKIADVIGFARPSNLTSTINLDERRFVRAIEDSIVDVAACAPPEIIREYTFYTASGQEAYPLPGDFGGFVPNTNWNKTRTQPMELIPAAAWQQDKSGIAAAAYTQRYRMKGYNDTLGRFYVDPTPTGSAEQYVFEYLSTAYIKANWSGQQTSRHITISNNTAGTPVQVRNATASVTIPAVFLVTNNLGSGAGSSMEGRVFSVGSATVSNGFSKAWLQGTDGRDFEASGSMAYRAVTAFVASASDTLLINETLVEKGAEWRMRKAVGLSYANEKMDFDNACALLKGRTAGASILSLAGPSYGALGANLPDSNFTR